MSDVSITYNEQVVSLEQLLPLVDLLRPAIAEIVSMAEAAILFQFLRPDHTDGYADVDMSIVTTLDGSGRTEAVNKPIAEAVRALVSSYVQENKLENVRSIGCVARVAPGSGFYEQI